MNTKNLTPADEILRKLGPLTFARFLSAERTRAGLTQSQTAHKLGVSPQMVSAIENGRKAVSVELAAKIARKLGVSSALAVEACLQDQIRRAHVKLRVSVSASAA